MVKSNGGILRKDKGTIHIYIPHNTINFKPESNNRMQVKHSQSKQYTQ